VGRQLRREGTHAERVLWQKLRNNQINGAKFRRQQPIGNYIVDFVSPDESGLIIEIDGGQHNEDRILRRDKIRTEWLNSQGFRVIRFWNIGVLENLEGVLQQIEAVLGIEAPSPKVFHLCGVSMSPAKLGHHRTPFSSSPIEGEENGRFND